MNLISLVPAICFGLATVGAAFGQDCNSNGIPDSEEIAAGQVEDCDGNGVPDECQVDSDGDGVPNACDLCPDGDDRLDRTQDGIPDDCQCFENACQLGQDCADGICSPILGPDLLIGLVDIADPNAAFDLHAEFESLPILRSFASAALYDVWVSARVAGMTEGATVTVELEVFLLSDAANSIGNNLGLAQLEPSGVPGVQEFTGRLRHAVIWPAEAPLTLCRAPALMRVIVSDTESQDQAHGEVFVVLRPEPFSALCPCIDSDGDSVCDPNDVCDGGDDRFDSDGDGVPNDCDPCPLPGDIDTDGDGFCDSVDICPGGDDLVDVDGDGVPDSCDPCPVDAPDDSDGDGTCDSDDQCTGGDDSVDSDGDGVPDFCDICPADADDDSDGDGSCDSEDVCPGGNDLVDTDADTVPDFCDSCPGFDDRRDLDLDGVADLCDTCPFVADPNQADCDGDGYGDACDSLDRVVITAQPAGLVLCPGDVAILDVDAVGQPPLTFRWYRDGDLLPAQTGSLFLINDVSLADEGVYMCEVENGCGVRASEPASITIERFQGDFNNDLVVDLADLARLLADFGCESACVADADFDGDSDLSDLAVVLAEFGASCQ